MHAFKAAKRNCAKQQKQLQAKTLAPAIAYKAICTPVMHYVCGVRGAYAMQTGKLVNAKNITIYAVFGCALAAANYVAANKMGLYAQVIAQ